MNQNDTVVESRKNVAEDEDFSAVTPELLKIEHQNNLVDD